MAVIALIVLMCRSLDTDTSRTLQPGGKPTNLEDLAKYLIFGVILTATWFYLLIICAVVTI